MKRLLFLLLLPLSLYSIPKVKFRGYTESSLLGSISLDLTEPDSIERRGNQGLSILSNQYIKLVPEKGISIIGSFNQIFLLGIAIDEYPPFYNEDDSYLIGLDIERLYFNLRKGGFKTSFGVQRLSRGFNFAFTPFDFINSNSVTSSNRPKGKLSLLMELETTPFSNISLYIIPSENPMEREIWSSTVGGLYKHYGGIIDFQGQYNLIFPEVDSGEYLHLLGLAFKGDHIVGYSLESLYTISREDPELEIENLDVSIGIDYTFDLTRELGIRAEYLFNGDGLDRDSNWDPFQEDKYPFKHNLWGSLNLEATDELKVEVGGVFSIATTSALAMVKADYRVSDLSSLSLSADIPMDRTGWDRNDIQIDDIGEYGPLRMGNELSIALTYKIKY